MAAPGAPDPKTLAVARVLRRMKEGTVADNDGPPTRYYPLAVRVSRELEREHYIVTNREPEECPCECHLP